VPPAQGENRLITLTLTAAAMPGPRLRMAPMTPRSDLPRCRSITAQYRLDMLAEHDAADPAARGVLLNREGLYSSHLSDAQGP
jgi:hypothetical protein